MNPFKAFWNRSETFEFQKEQALTMQGGEQPQQDPIEAIKQAEREREMISDQKLSEFILAHPSLHSFIPALSPVNRTTKHISKNDAHIQWLDFEILCIMEEMCMRPEEYESGGLEILQGLKIYASTQISDGYEGWKGSILTEQRKRFVSTLQKGGK